LDNQNTENIVEKKERRGRKKKNKEVEVKIKKKRGRKASSQFYSSVIRKKLPNLLEPKIEEQEQHQKEEEKNIILHLNVDDEIDNIKWSEYDINNTEQLDLEVKNSKDIIDYDIPNIISILKDFNSNNEWPEKTDIKCWWCCHNFETVPLGIPMKIYNNNFYLKGCFCSFNCILAYVNDNSTKYKYDIIYPNIKSLRFKLTNKIINEILNPAPPRESLKIFGGELTIEQFRNASNDYIFKRINYPMKIIIDQIEKIDLVKPIINKSSVSGGQSQINSDIINQAQIRISKNKEMKTVTNTLDKFLLNF
jgi:hypothetical protein